jgi:hypothetical protein
MIAVESPRVISWLSLSLRCSSRRLGARWTLDVNNRPSAKCRTHPHSETALVHFSDLRRLALDLDAIGRVSAMPLALSCVDRAKHCELDTSSRLIARTQQQTQEGVRTRPIRMPQGRVRYTHKRPKKSLAARTSSDFCFIWVNAKV